VSRCERACRFLNMAWLLAFLCRLQECQRKRELALVRAKSFRVRFKGDEDPRCDYQYF
jgi:hypothetical protein